MGVANVQILSDQHSSCATVKRGIPNINRNNIVIAHNTSVYARK